MIRTDPPRTHWITGLMLFFGFVIAGLLGAVLQAELDGHQAEDMEATVTPLPAPSELPAPARCATPVHAPVAADPYNVKLPPRQRLVVNGTVVVPALQSNEQVEYLSRFHFRKSIE